MQVQQVRISAIRVSAANVRKDLQAGTEDATLEDLALSIRTHGLLSPVLVRRLPDGTYELIAGQRRLLACQRLGWETIPAIVCEVAHDLDALTLSLVENVHRADLNPIDKARAFQKLYEHYRDIGLVAKMTGFSSGTVRKYLALLKLAPEVQERVSTAEGPVGVEVLAKVAQTFPQDQHEEVLEKIGGFKRAIQLEILKRSGGDIHALEQLRQEALEGAFDARLCRGLHECPLLPPEVRLMVLEALADYQETRDLAAFRNLIRKLRG